MGGWCSYLSLLVLPPRSSLFPYTTLSDLSRVSPCRRSRWLATCLTSRSIFPLEATRDFTMFASRRHKASQSLLQHRKVRSEEHTSELQSRQYLVCRLLLEKKKDDKHVSRL